MTSLHESASALAKTMRRSTAPIQEAGDDSAYHEAHELLKKHGVNNAHALAHSVKHDLDHKDKPEFAEHLNHLKAQEDGAPSLPHGVMLRHTHANHDRAVHLSHSARIPNISVHAGTSGMFSSPADINMSSGHITNAEDGEAHHAMVAHALHHLKRFTSK